MKRLSNTRMPIVHVTLLLLGLAAMNVIGRYYYFTYIALIFFCLKPNRKFKVDIVPVILLFLVGLSWVLFSPATSLSIFGLIKPFTYVLCYIIGASMLDDDDDYGSNEAPLKLFYKLIVFVSAGSFCHYLINWFTNFGSRDRNTIDIWTKLPMGATGQAALACLPLGLAIACLFFKSNAKIKIASIATIILVLGYNLILSGRTLIIMCLILIAFGFLHSLSMQKKGRWRLILIVAVAIVLLVYAYNSNLFNIRTYVEESPIYERFFLEDSTQELDEDGRMRMKIYHLQNMGRYLFGGANIRKEIGHAHDILLDTYDEAGIIAFIAMFVYLFVGIIHLVKCLNNKSLPFAFRNIIACIYIILYIEFMVEPILQGVPWLFATFCLIDGYVSRILSYDKTVKLKARWGV